VKISHIIIQNI